MSRPEPPLCGTEREISIGFLDFLRETIILKVDGLTETQARQTLPPSTMSILGMIQHLQYVERWWFRKVFRNEDVAFPWTADDPDADWRVDDAQTITDVVANYRNEVSICNRIIADSSFDDRVQYAPPERQDMQLRWIVTHMIEETGRHCGHADLIRESIDGAVGE